MKKYIIIVCGIMFLFIVYVNIQNNNVSPVVKLFKEHLNETISLDGYSHVHSDDSISDYSVFREKYPYLIINYIDEDCSVCKFKLKEWYKYADMLPKNEQLAYVFIYRGENLVNYLKSILGKERELHPFYYLYSDEFTYIVNNPHIDRQIIDSGFLIDKENQIKVIGTPLTSSGVKELINKVIQ